MKLRAKIDNRGVSEIIGAILVFGLVVLSLVIFQTNAVPSANEEVEFDHNQEVQSDLIGLDAELSDAAASGHGGTAVVTVGMDYPTRFLFRNPPPVSGSLTTETSRFTIENAVAVEDNETDDYWNSTESPVPHEYTSRRLVYRVDYNVYDEAPETVLAHGIVYDRFEDGPTRRIDAGGLVDGRSIELTALDGRRNESRVGVVSVPVTAQAAPTETVRVSDGPGGDNVNLTLRTEATATNWTRFLEDEEHVEAVLGAGDAPDVEPGTVKVVLEEGVTYELELARVSVGSAPYTATPAYVTSVGPTTRTVTVGTATDLTVEVRDQYNAPVAGEQVTFSVDDGDGAPTTETVPTDDEGRASLSYTPSESVTVTATVDGGTGADGDPLSVVYDLTASSAGRDGGGGSAGAACSVPDWSSTTTSLRLENAEECTWSGVGRVDRLSLSDPAMTPLKADGTVDPGKQYLRLAMVVTDGNTTYLLEVPDNREGVSRQFDDGNWGNKKVHVFKRAGDGKYRRIADTDLTDGALDNFYQGGSLDLLDGSSYRRTDPGIVELRNFLRQNTVTIRVVENDGAVTLTADSG